MNGFEPLRRRVIDYTVAGQWQEVYDGPIEECEEYRLADENVKLRGLVNSYADLFEKEAATNNGHGPYYSGEDWLALANDMRIELAKCCGELRIEVE